MVANRVLPQCIHTCRYTFGPERLTVNLYILYCMCISACMHNSVNNSALNTDRNGLAGYTNMHRIQSFFFVIYIDVDASGKPGSGIFGGNLLWFGSYSECKKQSKARYCLSSFSCLIKKYSKQNYFNQGKSQVNVSLTNRRFYHFLRSNQMRTQVIASFSLSCLRVTRFTATLR